MTAFRFDAGAALRKAREGRLVPNTPNSPNPVPPASSRLGRLGRLGQERSHLDAARAHIACLADADGIARSDAAIEAVWDWAEALARQNVTRKDATT